MEPTRGGAIGANGYEQDGIRAGRAAGAGAKWAVVSDGRGGVDGGHLPAREAAVEALPKGRGGRAEARQGWAASAPMMLVCKRTDGRAELVHRRHGVRWREIRSWPSLDRELKGRDARPRGHTTAPAACEARVGATAEPPVVPGRSLGGPNASRRRALVV